jgi:Glycosyltransferase family 87
MAKLRRMSVWLILLCNGLSILTGVALDSASSAGMMNFRAIYYGARCLIRHTDPYKPKEFLRIYQDESGKFPTNPDKAALFERAVTVCVNLPTTLFIIAPFALLAWWPAHILWLIVIGVVFTGASLLAWDLAAEYAPVVSVVLICFLAANNQVLFIVGNTAAIAVGLAVAAVWCFFRERFVFGGVVCLALSLVIKPHDSGLIWLYLLLAGGATRKRAVQSLVLAVLLAIPAIVWVSRIAPDWKQELQANLAATSSHGDISDPGPDNLSRKGSADVLIDLQTVISVFKDDPRVYNTVSLLICGTLLLAWVITNLRSPRGAPYIWFALACAAPLSMLATYHRPYDTRILLLAVPACALLWSQGGSIGRFAAALTFIAVVVTGDVSLGILSIATGNIDVHSMSMIARVLLIPVMRPAPIVLLVMASFYLWWYIKVAGVSRHELKNAVEEPA